MGYNTKFEGKINLSRKLTLAEADALMFFNDDPKNISGKHPNSYLQWVPSTTLDAIGWDGQEKFYDHIEWMRWLCEWLQARDIVCNGVIYWAGDDVTDTGQLHVVNNNVIATKMADKPERFFPLTRKRLMQIMLDGLKTEEKI